MSNSDLRMPAASGIEHHPTRDSPWPGMLGHW
jgi:hypothetical protein